MRALSSFAGLVLTALTWVAVSPALVLGADMPAGGGAVLLRSNSPPLFFSTFTGGGSENEVVELVVGGVRRKIPGRLAWKDVIASRALDSRMDLWEWRDSILQISSRQNIAFALLDFHGLEIRRDLFVRAWPASLRMETSSNAVPVEIVSITHEGKPGLSIDPEITLDAPAPGAVFWNVSNIIVEATAAFPAVVQQIQFFAGASLLGVGKTAQSGQFDFTWTNPPTGDHTLSAVATDSLGVTYAADNVRSIAVRYGLTYELWRQASGYFQGEALSNPGISGPFADPDLDFIRNLLEYAGGSNPNDAESHSAARLWRDSTGLYFEYRRRTGGVPFGWHEYQYGDIRYVVETSADLKTWAPATDVFSGGSAAQLPGGAVEDVALRLDAGAFLSSGGFLRLRVQLLP